MNEQLPAEKQTRKITPFDLANLALRRNSIEADEHSSIAPKAGDIIEHDGIEEMYVPQYFSSKKIIEGKYVNVQVPYTYRQYYAHSFEDETTRRFISAPGWDSRFRLQDDSIALGIHGRTFSPRELSDLPNNLPNEEALFLRPIDSYEVEDYLESHEE